MDSSMTFDEFAALEDNEETSVEMMDEDILEMAKRKTNEENNVKDGPEEECDPQDAPIETNVDFLTALSKVYRFLAKKNVSSSSLDCIETELLQKWVAGSQTSLKSFFTPTKDSYPGGKEKPSRPHGTPPSAKQSKSGGKAHLMKKSKPARETEPQLGTSKQVNAEQEENILVNLTQEKTAEATSGTSLALPALPCLPVDLMDLFDDTFDFEAQQENMEILLESLNSPKKKTPEKASPENKTAEKNNSNLNNSPQKKNAENKSPQKNTGDNASPEKENSEKPQDSFSKKIKEVEPKQKNKEKTGEKSRKSLLELYKKELVAPTLKRKHSADNTEIPLKPKPVQKSKRWYSLDDVVQLVQEDWIGAADR